MGVQSKKRKSLKSVVKGKVNPKIEPVWKGPEVDGITQSLLSKFVTCKERFKLHVIDGLKPREGFSIPLEYGQMWHTCEEVFAAHKDWRLALKKYANSLMADYPDDRGLVLKFYLACKHQFEVYSRYWQEHEDVKNRTPFMQEVSFKVPYELPSGRVVLLRGKWDSVDFIGKGKNRSIYLQENKTKGNIKEAFMLKQLTYDMQTMIYIIALKESKEVQAKKAPVNGIRYNVVRRPFSGGVGMIKQRSATKSNPHGESLEDFHKRLQEYYIKDPEHWFMRWRVEISDADVQNFKDTFLDPCLEHLCLWYDYVTGKDLDEHFLRDHFSFVHYRTPFGIYNNVGNGGEIEEYLTNGSKSGLVKIENLFPELD